MSRTIDMPSMPGRWIAVDPVELSQSAARRTVYAVGRRRRVVDLSVSTTRNDPVIDPAQRHFVFLRGQLTRITAKAAAKLRATGKFRVNELSQSEFADMTFDLARAENPEIDIALVRCDAAIELAHQQKENSMPINWTSTNPPGGDRVSPDAAYTRAYSAQWKADMERTAPPAPPKAVTAPDLNHAARREFLDRFIASPTGQFLATRTAGGNHSRYPGSVTPSASIPRNGDGSVMMGKDGRPVFEHGPGGLAEPVVPRSVPTREEILDHARSTGF